MKSRRPVSRALRALLAPVALASGGHAQCLDWSDAFGAPGVDGEVFASIVHDDGLGGGPMLIVGGQFSSAGGADARGLARWDGSAWAPLGSGLQGGGWASAQAFAVHDDGSGEALYVAGSFTSAGGVPAANIARWDGSAWSAVGGGLNGVVRALAAYDDGLGGGPQLHAGGLFTLADGQPAQRLARWDGWSWSEVGGGVPGVNASVHDLLVHDAGNGPELHVAGSFSQLGTTAVANVARWNGLAWSGLGGGTNGAVMALAAYDAGSGPRLHAGGEFTSAGGTAAGRIARWNGTGWSPLGAGVDDTVRALGVHDDGSGPALIVGGQFHNADGAPARGIARWRRSGWSPLGAGLQAPHFASAWTVCSLDGAPPGAAVLVVGGSFSAVGSVGASHVAAWEGSSWTSLGAGQGLSGTGYYASGGARAFTAYDDGQGNGPELYMAGGYDAAGTTLTGGLGLMRWDGSRWNALPAPPGTLGYAGALAVFDPGSGPGLYVSTESGVRMWNGTTWDPGQSIAIHGSLGGVHAMTVHDDGSGPALYLGGSFTDGCFSGKFNILRWDGSTCSAVGGGLGVVQALIEHDDGSGLALYAAGATSIFPPTAGYVARWAGAQWTYLGRGMDAGVQALATFDDGSGPALYAGGRFQIADGTPAAGIARWNGTTWSPVGGGITAPAGGRVHALVVHAGADGAGPGLYAAGRFQEVGQVPAASIARWDGAGWSALGLGIETGDLVGAVEALHSFDDGAGSKLWAGGFFDGAGGRPSIGVARWGEACGCAGTIYCSAQTSSSGCVPSMSAAGDTRLSGSQPFALVASQVPSGVTGLLFYGTNGATARPFAGGTLCVRPPLTRTVPQSSGGNPPPLDCSGGLSLDFKAHALSGADPRLTAGTTVQAQYWYRDPAAPGGSGTTDAVSFTLCP